MEHPRTSIKEFVHAINMAQALKTVALRLEKRYRQKVYLGDCLIREVPENPGKKK
jgi:hypothetical protein